MISFVFKQSNYDHCLFTLINGGIFFFVLIVYVDDILLTGNDDNEIQDVKGFCIKDLLLKILGSLTIFRHLVSLY